MVFEMARLKFSRAKWLGEYYFRKNSGTWRNARTGQVLKGTPQGLGKSKLGFEFRYANSYGSDPRGRKEALKRVKDLHKGDEKLIFG